MRLSGLIVLTLSALGVFLVVVFSPIICGNSRCGRQGRFVMRKRIFIKLTCGNCTSLKTKGELVGRDWKSSRRTKQGRRTMRWQKTLSDATRLIDQPVAPSLRWRRPHERVKLSNKRLMTEVFRVYFRRTRSGVCIDLLLREYANKLTISRNLLDCMRWWRCYMCSDHNRPDSLSARSDGGEECRFALKSRSWSTQKPLENSNGLIKKRCDGRCCIINVHSSSPSIITRTHLCQAPSELCPMLYVAFSPKTPAHQTFLAKNIPRSLTANNSRRTIPKVAERPSLIHPRGVINIWERNFYGRRQFNRESPPNFAFFFVSRRRKKSEEKPRQINKQLYSLLRPL